MPEGFIVKGYGGFYFVQSGDTLCRCRGRGRLHRGKDVLLTGDRVLFTFQKNGDGVIESVMPRRSSLRRPPVANVEQVVLILSLAYPEPDFLLLDRLLVLCGVEELDVLVCFTKLDLVDIDQTEDWAGIYRQAGYRLILTSARQGTGLDELRRQLKGKISVVAGPSGVGKSTLLNALDPRLALETGEISQKIQRGKHTTRYVQLLTVAGGFVADTPGFSNLELPVMKRTELRYLFPEMDRLAGQCRFLDCLHISEPDCAVKKALAEGLISRSRYQNYQAFLIEVMAKERIYQ
jgi:ribosome biogenesis GTPase